MPENKQKSLKVDVGFYKLLLWRQGSIRTIMESKSEADLNKYFEPEFHLTSDMYQQLVSHLEEEMLSMRDDLVKSCRESLEAPDEEDTPEELQATKAYMEKLLGMTARELGIQFFHNT